MPAPTFAPLPERRDVSPEVFCEEIMPAGQAVVLRGVASDWPMVTLRDDARAIADYLRPAARPGSVNIMRSAPSNKGRFFYGNSVQEFNYDKADMRFGAFLDDLLAGAGGDALYMGSTPVPQIVPGLSGDFALPHVPQDTVPRLWIGNRTVVSTHHDSSSNIACVAAGRRTFTLFPPDQVANLYVGPIEHTMAGVQVSLVDLDAPDLDRYPRYAEALASARSAELGPGDAIYMPPLWWHHVRATADFNVLVNFWWRHRPDISREPLEAMVLSLLSLRQLPAPERDAWRAMFDYFIFQSDGPPMAHMDADARGVLGEITPDRAQKIWAYFKSQMR